MQHMMTDRVIVERYYRSVRQQEGKVNMYDRNLGVKQENMFLKVRGKLDRGPVDLKSHIAVQEGEIMAIATRDVLSVPPTRSIICAVETMTEFGFHRLPVTDAGSQKLRGIIHWRWGQVPPR